MVSKGGEGRVGVERDERIPGEAGSGVNVVVAVAEPQPDVRIGIGQVRDAAIAEDALGVAVTAAIASDTHPDRENADIGRRVGLKDVVGDPTGPRSTAASSPTRTVPSPQRKSPDSSTYRCRGTSGGFV
jgi:hypothetical protein